MGNIMNALASHTPNEARGARLVTDAFEPKNWILLVTVLVGWNADRIAGIGWGLLGALFAAIIPVLFIKYGMKKGRWADRHVGVRQHRLVVMTFIIASVGAGIALLIGLGAPRSVIALIVAMLVTLASLMAITVKWKISVHAAVSSGAVAMLALAYGPWMLAGYTLVALVGWSRIALRDHTPAQVLAGAALGAGIAATTFALLR
jgi:membrane-associated phospholipid phosphatase